MYSNILKIMQYKYIFMTDQTMYLYQTMSTTSMEERVDTCKLIKNHFHALYDTCNLIKLYFLLLRSRDRILASDNVSNCLTASDSRTSLLDSRTSLSKLHSAAVRI